MKTKYNPADYDSRYMEVKPKQGKDWEEWEDKFAEAYYGKKTQGLIKLREWVKKQLSTQRSELVKQLEKKSVAELKDKMGMAYHDLSVQVAYKEGYNGAVNDLLEKLNIKK